MSSYCNYFLEQKINNKWIQLDSLEKVDNELPTKIIYWHTGSYGLDFSYNYIDIKLGFNEYAINVQKQYKDAYENNRCKNDIFKYYPDYYLMNINKMIEDYKNNIHEYSGIITKNDKLKIIDNPEYIPDIISPSDFNKLPDNFKENYVFYSWDSPWSEYIHIYDLIPIIDKMLSHYQLSYKDVRLTYYYD